METLKKTTWKLERESFNILFNSVFLWRTIVTTSMRPPKNSGVESSSSTTSNKARFTSIYKMVEGCKIGRTQIQISEISKASLLHWDKKHLAKHLSVHASALAQGDPPKEFPKSWGLKSNKSPRSNLKHWKSTLTCQNHHCKPKLLDH